MNKDLPKKIWVKNPYKEFYEFKETEIAFTENCKHEPDFRDAECYVHESEIDELEKEQVLHIEILKDEFAKRIDELKQVVRELDKHCMKLKNTLEGFHYEDCIATNLEMDDELECDCGTQKVVDEVVLYLDNLERNKEILGRVE